MAIHLNRSLGSIIRNSTITGNYSIDAYAGAIESFGWRFSRGTIITLQHVTMYNNKQVGGTVDLAMRFANFSSGTTVNTRNSLILGECQISFGMTLSAAGSLSDDATCVAEDERDGTFTSKASPSDLGEFVPVSGSKGGYFKLSHNSRALGLGVSPHCLTRDQRNDPDFQRPDAVCHIGAAAERSPPPPPPELKPKPQTSRAPVGALVSSCPDLPPAYRVRGHNPGTQCQALDGRGIGILELAQVYIGALDVWGWLGAGVEVCIAGSGSLVFLDAADAPRQPAPVIDAYSDGGFTCMLMTRPGSLVLVPGPAAPAKAPVIATQGLAGCMVRTNYLMNLRGSPGGAIIGEVRYEAALTALARTAGWFQVDANGVAGWLSADYVTPIGSCG